MIFFITFLVGQSSTNLHHNVPPSPGYPDTKEDASGRTWHPQGAAGGFVANFAIFGASWWCKYQLLANPEYLASIVQGFVTKRVIDHQLIRLFSLHL